MNSSGISETGIKTVSFNIIIRWIRFTRDPRGR